MKAQSEAWGSALRRGAYHGEAERKAARKDGVGWLDVLIWRIRGGLFCSALGMSWCGGLLGVYGLHLVPKYR